MRFDFNLTTWEDWSFGVKFYVAEDDHGMHRCLEFGFLFFQIEIAFYSDNIDPYRPQ